ncbi:hypothetical protein [Streptomyces sp. NPDC053048]|uniref:hypothetical protein n=1 Tax=Streptomyces sp. NPDC053048 TaxID=3365694 RepID=UPI0037D76F5D
MPALSALSVLPLARPPGRARRALLVGAATLVTAATAGAAQPRADTPQQHCGAPRGTNFPITSRLTGGPGAYRSGAPPRAWRLELRNATAAECRAVHPVAVLADKRRALQPGHVRLDFYDADRSRWLPVRFERTEEAENVGVLDDRSAEFPGFDVPAQGSVTVPLRLAFTGDAPEGPVTANVTAVQRRGPDGAWVGESGDYTFAVERAPATPSATPPATPPSRAATPGGSGSGSDGGGSAPPVLADSGDARPLFGVGATACVLLVTGTALLAGSRRLGRRPERPGGGGVRRPPGTDR